MEKPNQIPKLDLNKNSTDPIPEQGCFRTMEENAANEASTRKEAPRDPNTAPLTIFYAGKIMMFDDFPADEARAVMLLASEVSHQGDDSTTTVSPSPQLASPARSNVSANF